MRRARNSAMSGKIPIRSFTLPTTAFVRLPAFALAAALLIALAPYGAPPQQPSEQGSEPYFTATKAQHPEIQQATPEATTQAPAKQPELPADSTAKGNGDARTDSIEFAHLRDIGELIRAAFAYVLPRLNGIAVTLFTGLLALFSYLLYRATLGLRDSARDQHTAMMETISIGRQNALAAEKSARIAEDTLVATQRPWVTADIQVGGPLRYDVNGANITVRFILRNIGHSPAMHVWIDAQVTAPTFLAGDQWDLQGQQRQIISDLRSRPPYPYGYVIFPGMTAVQDFTLMISQDELKKITKNVEFIAPTVDGSCKLPFSLR